MQKEKVLRKAVRGSLVLLCLFCILFLIYIRKSAANFGVAKAVLPLLPTSEGIKVAKDEVPAFPVITPEGDPVTGPMATLAPLPAVWQEVAGAQDSAVVRLLPDADVIIIEKREGYDKAKIFLEEFPVTRQLRVTVCGIWGEALSDEQIKRIAKDTYYHGTPPSPTPTLSPTPTPAKRVTPTPLPTADPTYAPSDPYYVWRNDVLRAVEMTVELAEDSSLTQSFLLTLDKTYVYRLYEDQWNYYIALVRPKDVYDKIIVVDAGHGGVDEGTAAQGRKYLEKNMNLDIVLRLKELLDAQDDIKVYYTRTTDQKPSLRQRVDLANDVGADFFLSVHCNANEARSLHGTEVLYDSRQNALPGMNSRRFAQILLAEMDEHLGLFNRGLVPREDTLTIIRYAKVPVALVEVAFMSNTSDMEILAREQTRADVAQGLFDAIMRGYMELEEMGMTGEETMGKDGDLVQ